MRAGRGLIGALGVLLVTAGTLPPASADGEGGGEGRTGAYVDPHGSPTVTARDGVQSRPVSSRQASSQNCEWRVVIEDDSGLEFYDDEGTVVQSETGRWLERWCDGEHVLVGGQALVPEGRGVDPRALALEARQSVPIASPPIGTSPSADRRLYAQVPTWLWVDEAWWQPYSATASAGAVSATVTARPVRAIWSTGDGGGTTCDGPGVEWQEGMAEEETYCSYVYRRSSAGEPDGTFTLTVTVEFEVTWTSSVGAGGTLTGVSRSASRAVEVGEIQAVRTR